MSGDAHLFLMPITTDPLASFFVVLSAPAIVHSAYLSSPVLHFEVSSRLGSQNVASWVTQTKGAVVHD